MAEKPSVIFKRMARSQSPNAYQKQNTDKSSLNNSLNQSKQLIKQINWQSLKKLKQQNYDIKEEISLEEKNTHNYEIKILERIQKFQKEGQSLVKKIDEEQRRFQTLSLEMEATKQEIDEKKKLFTSSGDNNISETIQRLKVLEHRQEKYMQKNNELFATILKTKEQLKQSRRERVIFDNIFTNLENDLKQKEEKIKKLSLQSLQSESYCHWLSQLQQYIQQIHEYEIQNFTQNCKETLSQKPIKNESQNSNLQNQQILSNALINSNSQRQVNKLQNSQQQITSFHNGNYDEGESEDVISQFNSNYLGQTQEKLDIEIDKLKELQIEYKNLEEEFMNNEISMEKLLILAQCNDINDFIQKHQQIDQNIEDIYKENEQLQEKIHEIEQKIEKIDNNQDLKTGKIAALKQVNPIKGKKDRKFNMLSEIKEISSQIQDMSLEQNIYKEILINAGETMPQIYKENQILDEYYLRQNIHLNIHPLNFLDFLTVIEQRVDEIVMMEQAIQDQNLFNKVYGELPYDLPAIKQKQQKLQLINEILNSQEKQKEADKIMTKEEFQQMSKQEVNRYIQKQEQQESFQTTLNSQNQTQNYNNQSQNSPQNNTQKSYFYQKNKNLLDFVKSGSNSNNNSLYNESSQKNINVQYQSPNSSQNKKINQQKSQIYDNQQKIGSKKKLTMKK